MAGGCGLWQEATGHCDAVVGSSVVASFVGSGVNAAVGCSGRWQRWRRMNRLVVEGRHLWKAQAAASSSVVMAVVYLVVSVWLEHESSKKFITFVFLIIY